MDSEAAKEVTRRTSGPYGTVKASRAEAKSLTDILEEQVSFNLTFECHLSNGKYSEMRKTQGYGK